VVAKAQPAALHRAVDEETYEQIALGDDRLWELHDGRLAEKLGMGAEHNESAAMLFGQLFVQLDPAAYRLRSNSARLRHPSGSHYIPDVAVVPVDLARQRFGRRGRLETYDAPLPLVVEVWSPSTGEYDVDTKVPRYQERGDQEIWRLHPYDRTLRRWLRQPDGSYREEFHQGGTVRPASLPNVAVDLDALFVD